MLCNRKFLEVLIILITSIIVISVFSRSSFLYPFNDWVDANCYFTVGKSILSGKIPYKDLLDQKGPFLYFIQMIGALISYKSFGGIFILEVFASFFFLFISYSTLKMLYPRTVLYLIPCSAIIIYGSTCFSYGDSAEEFSLPLLSYGLYLCVTYMSKKRPIKRVEFFFLGVAVSCVFWIKFTLVGFFISLYLWFFYILVKRKDWKSLIALIRDSLFGFMIVSLGILVYYYLNDAIYDLFHVYFYTNIFSYNHSSTPMTIVGLLLHELGRIKYGLFTNPALALSILLGLLFFVKKPQFFFFFLMSFLFELFFICISKTYDYYYFIISLFVPMGLLFVDSLIRRLNFRLSSCSALFVLYFISIIYSYKYSTNLSYVCASKDTLPQFQFLKIIEKVESPSILNYYSMDLGVYTLCGVVPDCKFFAMLNVNREDIKKGQDNYIEKKKPDFIVTRGKKVPFINYQLRYQCDYPVLGIKTTYYLYQLKNN